MTETVLETRDLNVVYPHRLGDSHVVRDVTVTVGAGEIVGLVGESGAGKSTVGNAVIRLLDPPGRISAGQVLLRGEEISALPAKAMAEVRGRRIGMIFQDPMTSLNPLLRIGDQVAETIANIFALSHAEAWARARDILDRVGISDLDRRMRQYPHEFSGGMRQRVVIALALCGNPELLIADEPTTALDVSIQKQILDLIRAECTARNLGVILVTHDMGVIAEVTDRVYVMYKATPEHPYSRNLIAAIPNIDRTERTFRVVSGATGGDHRMINAWLRTPMPDDAPPGVPGVPFLSVREVSCDFLVKPALLPRHREWFRAVDSVSFDIAEGETLGLVGESGSGKSTLGRMIVDLLPTSAGDVVFRDFGGVRDHAASSRRMVFRRNVQIVFQDPYSSLNARMRVKDILAEPMLFHGLVNSAEEARDLVAALLARVGLDATAGEKYPHQFSGGQRQRICIARALGMRPRFLVCDEPTSALDVSIQAEILNLLNDLKAELNLTMLFISHDLAVVRQMCDRVAVMQNGRLCEIGETERIFEAPEAAYTRNLLAAVPRLSPRAAE